MFIVTLTYTAPLAQLDAHLAAHRAWLGEQVAQGRVLVAGPQEPRSGGVIVAQAASRAELDDALRADPFARHGLATYAVTEFVPGVAAPALAAWRMS